MGINFTPDLRMPVIHIQDIFRLIVWVINSIGYFMLLRKCGVFPLWGFIPFVREYQISRCADREKEGRTFAVIAVIYGALMGVRAFFPEDSDPRAVLAICVIAVGLALLLYEVRIYEGLCQIFVRRKRWVWAWFLFQSITCLIWGFNKDFQPGKKVEKRDKKAGARVSGIDTPALENGLTVNIMRYIFIDFFLIS